MRMSSTYDLGPDEVSHHPSPDRNYMETLGAAGAWNATPSDLVTIINSIDHSTRGWKALSEEDRATLRAAAARTEERLQEAVPRQDREAVAEMEKRGLTVSKPSDPEAWRELGDRFAALMRGSYVPEALFDRAVSERDAFRRERGEGR